MDTLHHVAISVHDIGKAVEWFTTRFDCRLAYQDESWALLEFANISLALVIPGQHPPHIGILRDDAETFGALQAHRDGSRSVYLDGPDGNTVEVVDAGSVSPARD